MFDLGSVVAHVSADVGDFKRKMNEAEDSLNGFKGGLNKVSGVLTSVGKQSALFAGIVGGIGVLAIKDSIKAYQEQETALKQQETVLKSTHGAAGLYIEDLQDQASALQRMTPFADEAITAGQNLLLTFTQIKGPVFQEATGMILDMSQALGQDMKSSAIQLGKALNDPIQGVTALRRVGVSFNDAQLKQIATMQESGDLMGAQKLILKELQTEFGGSAKAAGETFAGKLAIMNNQIGELKEGIGKLILEAIAPLVDEITKFVQSDTFVELMEKLRAGLKAIGDWVSEHKEEVITFLKALGVALAALLVIGGIAIAIGLLMNPLTWLVGAIMLLYVAWEKNFFGIRDITTQVVDWIKDHWEQIRAVTQIVFDYIVGYIKLVWAIISGVFKIALALLKGDWSGAWEAMKDMFSNAWAAIKQMFGGALGYIKDWASDVFNKLTQPFRDAWNTIQDLVNKIKNALDFTKRHSPSVVDVVNKGVYEVNKALSKLDLNVGTVLPSASPAFSPAISPAGGSINSINVDLTGAVISDEASAMRIGEMIGDKIIKKLDSNIRI